MSKQLLEQIQSAVIEGEYDLTFHTIEEMAEDGLDIFDVEAAIINGRLTKTETEDPRGTRYTIIGRAVNNKTLVGVVGRFKETGVFLIVTAYEVSDKEE